MTGGGDVTRRAAGPGSARRAAITAALRAEPTFQSAQHVHARLRAAGQRVGLATVYRHLQALAAAGEIDLRRTEDGEVVYRRCATPRHHHHLVCRRCGSTVEVADAGVEGWADRIGAAHGFRDVRHTLDVVGTCGACSDAEQHRPG